MILILLRIIFPPCRNAFLSGNQWRISGKVLNICDLIYRVIDYFCIILLISIVTGDKISS